MQAIEGF